MPAEPVYFVLDGFLKSLQDEKRYNGGRQPDADADDCNLVDRRRKAFTLLMADPP